MTEATITTPAPPVGETRRTVIFAGLLLVLLLAALDSTIVSTALPTIVGELGGLSRLSWVVTAYLLAQTVVTPLYGKLGDLYGRKRVLQFAVVLFLIGSALCGMSRSMLQLILFRAIQGLGGGGLMVGTQAAIADVVPPRERGRYQGLFGAVFGVSSVAGPLLGGFFTSHFTWRWIFYINLPLGIVALVVLATTLPSVSNRVRHRVDYLGALLLAIALSGIILATDLGGITYPWSSPIILGTVVAAIVALTLFIVVERRAAEPVLPLHLFRNPVFGVSSAIGLIVGFALFGSVTYLPLFLQVVRGLSPTASGLQLLPMMGGMLVTSIVSGQVISRTGRYRFFPIAGTGVMALGLFMLSRVGVNTPLSIMSIYMAMLGIGLGMVMQVLVLAVQNAVEYKDLGVATSGATLFRFIGGSVGTAVLGAIFAGRLAANLSKVGLEAGAEMSMQSIAHLTAAQRAQFIGAFTSAIDHIFIIAAVIAAVGFALTWLLQEKPLRETVAAAASGVGEAFAAPATDEPIVQIERGLAALASRDTQRKLLERTAARANVDLTPAACWLLGRIDDDAAADVDALIARYTLDPGRLHAGLRQLLDQKLVIESAPRARHLTEEGRAILDRLVKARQEELSALLHGYSPEQHADLAALITQMAKHFADGNPA
jgi:EmrB/QacA subfamily drug resistance transporter